MTRRFRLASACLVIAGPLAAAMAFESVNPAGGLVYRETQAARAVDTATNIYAMAGVVTDAVWQAMDYDIGGAADLQGSVRVRWRHEVIGAASPYSGWNIDDV